MLLEILQTERQVQYPLLRLILWLAFLVVYIYMAQYIYKDALRRNLNAELWLLIVLVVPIASWIVYFLVRKEKSRIQAEPKI